jgi:hypothetical protein
MPEVELEVNPCVLCHKALKGPGGINATGDPSIVIFMSAVTRGLRPRLKTRALPKVFCYGCATSLALGVPPIELGDLYVSAWQLLRDLISMDDENSVVLAAVTQMRHPRARLRRMPGSIAPKQLPAAS